MWINSKACIPMAALEILLPFFSFVFILLLRCVIDIHGLPWNWPLIGMIPTIFLHVRRIHDRCTEVLERSGATFAFKAVWFAGMDILGTADPANIHHILSTNFQNYPKGEEFKFIFDILGDGIFNSDSDSWMNQRKMAKVLLDGKKFQVFLAKTTKQKVEEGIFTVLDTMSQNGRFFDLQDLFKRFSFDSTCKFVIGFDPKSLSIELPEIPFSSAMDEVEELLFFKHFIPKPLWKLQLKLGFGQAKKMMKAWEIIDETIAQLLTMKKEELAKNAHLKTKNEDEDSDLITSYMTPAMEGGDKLLRDTVLNLMIAGRDTISTALSWFFYLIATNPAAKNKIREEINKTITEKEEQKSGKRAFTIEELENLVYLRSALCESLRLYPPVPFQHKAPVERDVLPSGHHVTPDVKILFSLYTLGRLKSVWGEDSAEFRPERWISEISGKVKHEPSYKFLAFNAGPRTCIGKQVAFTQLKIVAASILHNYEIELLKGHPVTPSASIILNMKHGMKVRVTKRCPMIS